MKRSDCCHQGGTLEQSWMSLLLLSGRLRHRKPDKHSRKKTGKCLHYEAAPGPSKKQSVESLQQPKSSNDTSSRDHQCQ